MKTMSAARCNNNTHAVLKVDLLLESPMQGLHSSHFGRACCVGQQHRLLNHNLTLVLATIK